MKTDEVREVLDVALSMGYVEAKIVDGERKYRLTEAGRRFLEHHRDFDELIEVHEFGEEDGGKREEQKEKSENEETEEEGGRGSSILDAYRDGIRFLRGYGR